MGRVSTTDKEEAERTGKIFINKQNLGYLNMPKYQIDKCKYCTKILLEKKDRLIHYREDKDRVRAWDYKNYCSEWCYEMNNPPKIKYVCKECGIAVEPFMTNKKDKNGKTYYVSTGVYPKYCEEHKYIWQKRKQKLIVKD